jgi:hypothetical protein
MISDLVFIVAWTAVSMTVGIIVGAKFGPRR